MDKSISRTAHTNDVTGDPKFANYAADNVHLTTDSATIDAGIASGVTVDKDGVARHVTDLGAYEWHA